MIGKLSDKADRILIAANPKAGSSSRQALLDEFIDSIAHRGWRIEVLKKKKEVAERAEEWHRDGSLRALVAAGGDGTVAEMVNRTSPEIPIIPLPLGTENLLFRHLGIRRSAPDILRVIADGTTARIDAGMAGDRAFVLVASCGFDAEVVRRVHEARKGNISKLSYFKPIWDSLRNYTYPELKISYLPETATGDSEDQWQSHTARWVFVFNLPCYATGLKINPDATANDGLLDYCTFGKGSWSSTMGYWFKGMLGGHKPSEDCQMGRAKKLRIECEEEVSFQLDGDLGGTLPLELEAAPRRFTLIVPKEWANKQIT